MTVVRPGTQTRRFTHISDTIKVCMEAFEKNKNCHYSISSKISYSIKDVARMFNCNIEYLPKRPGERYASALTKVHLSNKIINRYGNTKLLDYVREFLQKQRLSKT